MPVIRILLLAVACLLCAQTFAQPATRRIRGEVAAIDGLELQVRTRTGENVAIDLDEKYAVSAVVAIDIASIKPGS